METTETRTGVSALVSSKMNTAVKEAAAENKQRFMLVLEDEVREDLRTLCEELNVKQISFASELFTVALADAKSAFAASKAKPAKPAPAVPETPAAAAAK